MATSGCWFKFLPHPILRKQRREGQHFPAESEAQILGDVRNQERLLTLTLSHAVVLEQYLGKYLMKMLRML